MRVYILVEASRRAYLHRDERGCAGIPPPLSRLRRLLGPPQPVGPIGPPSIARRTARPPAGPFVLSGPRSRSGSPAHSPGAHSGPTPARSGHGGITRTALVRPPAGRSRIPSGGVACACRDRGTGHGYVISSSPARRPGKHSLSAAQVGQPSALPSRGRRDPPKLQAPRRGEQDQMARGFTLPRGSPSPRAHRRRASTPDDDGPVSCGRPRPVPRVSGAGCSRQVAAPFGEMDGRADEFELRAEVQVGRRRAH